MIYPDQKLYPWELFHLDEEETRENMKKYDSRTPTDYLDSLELEVLSLYGNDEEADL